jgi:acetyl-CoA C-acetyltransferase
MPHGGAFRDLHAHDIAAPVVRALLERVVLRPERDTSDQGAKVHLLPEQVDALVCGNALGAGGNQARMVALAAGLPDACAAFSVDTQCCSGLDAVAFAVGLLASGQARVVIAGGVEAWSRSPIRQVRPLHPGGLAEPYERPAFAPDPARDPDLLEAAAHYARLRGYTRAQQDIYALQSHQRAVLHRAQLAPELVLVPGDASPSTVIDAYPRALSAERVARMPVAARENGGGDGDFSVSTLAVSTKADGAAFVLLATEQACAELGIQAQARWLVSASVGCAPEMPLLAAEHAAVEAMRRLAMVSARDLHALELHDAFAAQGLGFCEALGLDPAWINRCGGGIARGHPIGASGAVALVRVLADLKRDGPTGARGLAVVAGAGGIGAATMVERA